MADGIDVGAAASAEQATQGIVRACPSCGVKNRIPAGHLTDTGKCGSCHAELAPVGEPIDADEAIFDAVVNNSKVPVLVDFWAAWCGPCRMVAPEVHKAAGSMAGKALVLKVDTDRYPALAERFNVVSIPNFVVLKEGRVVMQRPGMVPQATIESWLKSA
jgi:thioredoxin 2